MTTPRISIILPVYNTREDFLRQCLDSLLAQTFEDFEMILVDDGSTDNTPAICQEYAALDSRITLELQEHGGVSTARNAGLAMAKGAYICFVDPDDYVEPTYVEQLYKMMKKTGADMAVCNAYVAYADRRVKNPFLTSKKELVLKGAEKARLQNQLVGKKLTDYYPPEVACGTPWAKMYKASFLEEHNLTFQKELIRMQDNVFNLYAMEAAESIAFLPAYLYNYRKETGSTCHHYNPDIMEYFERYYEASFAFLDKANKDDRLYRALEMKTLTSFNSYLAQYFFHKENKQSFRQKKKELKALLNREPYRTALDNIDYKLLTRAEALFVFLLKHRQFRQLKLLVGLRSQYKL